MTTLQTKITEAVNGAQVNKAAGILRRVKILGRTSTNGRIYTTEAMQQAAKLYEGAKVNLDHEHSPSQFDRSVADRLGVLRNVVVEQAGVFGDLHLLMAHPLAAMVMEAAEKMPETLGLSHNAEGKVRQEEDHVVVESIHRVHSVDLVQSPATVAGLFESERRDLEIAQLKSQISELKEQLEKLSAANTSARQARQLLESRNREATDIRVRSLMRCETDADREALIESWPELDLYATRPAHSPSILESTTDRYTATDGSSLARLLR